MLSQTEIINNFKKIEKKYIKEIKKTKYTSKLLYNNYLNTPLPSTRHRVARNISRLGYAPLVCIYSIFTGFMLSGTIPFDIYRSVKYNNFLKDKKIKTHIINMVSSEDINNDIIDKNLISDSNIINDIKQIEELEEIHLN